MKSTKSATASNKSNADEDQFKELLRTTFLQVCAGHPNDESTTDSPPDAPDPHRGSAYFRDFLAGPELQRHEAAEESWGLPYSASHATAPFDGFGEHLWSASASLPKGKGFKGQLEYPSGPPFKGKGYKGKGGVPGPPQKGKGYHQKGSSSKGKGFMDPWREFPGLFVQHPYHELMNWPIVEPTDEPKTKRKQRTNRSGRSKKAGKDSNIPQTTVMLRNLPNKYTQRMLLDAINEKEFQGTYDFFYLPIDFRNRCNVGYAFINFITCEDTERFQRVFQDLRLPAYNSSKVCQVTLARVQGQKANIENYRNSSVFGIPVPQYWPLIFKDGKQVRFPPPDAPLPPVQLRPVKKLD